MPKEIGYHPVMTYLFILFIKGYRKLISPVMPATCRFYPTCSEYAIESLRQYGAFKGLYLSIKRILKCQPYYKGDFLDPVPCKTMGKDTKKEH